MSVFTNKWKKGHNSFLFLSFNSVSTAQWSLIDCFRNKSLILEPRNGEDLVHLRKYLLISQLYVFKISFSSVVSLKFLYDRPIYEKYQRH